MRNVSGPTWVGGDGSVRPLRRVAFGDRAFDEARLQETLHTCPEILPVDELDADFGPLVSLGREIQGIDNLFVSPSGKLTIV